MAAYAKLGFGFFVAFLALDLFTRREFDGVLLWRSALAAAVAAAVLWLLAQSGLADDVATARAQGTPSKLDD